jgi:hypothetical protein
MMAIERVTANIIEAGEVFSLRLFFLLNREGAILAGIKSG